MTATNWNQRQQWYRYADGRLRPGHSDLRQTGITTFVGGAGIDEFDVNNSATRSIFRSSMEVPIPFVPPLTIR